MPKDVAALLGRSLGVLCDVIQTLDPVYEYAPNADGKMDAFPIWPLAPEERAETGEALNQILKTLPASQKKSVAKMLNKNVPTIMACIVLGKTFGPRVKFSIDAKRGKVNVNAPTVAPPSQNGSGAPRREPAAEGHRTTGVTEASAGRVYSGTAEARVIADAIDGV
jgi:hypothetical protein